HKTIFLLSPQRRSQDTQILDASRTDTLAIQTHIDSYINHVYYLWYKNNAYYKTCTYDKLTLSHLSFADSGTYHCEIKHDSFPDIAFRSDKYELKVNECINTNQLALHITPMDCEHRGVVSVSHTNNQKLKYILVPKSQYAGDTSVNGSFNNLVEGSYSLQIVTDKGCLVSYPKDINIAKENCTYPLITPNGDGDHDEYYFEQLGEVSIYDKKGNLIKTMSIPGPWDASSPTGKVRTGLYVADVNHGEKIIKISVVY
ncbi:MAG TPA: hypothetical protein VL947_13935, partial [Cytophagales bacterium]|nr:hypothetical protein [Cytophagales bacterium]